MKSLLELKLLRKLMFDLDIAVNKNPWQKNQELRTKFNLQRLILILSPYTFYPEALCDRNLKYGHIP